MLKLMGSVWFDTLVDGFEKVGMPGNQSVAQILNQSHEDVVLLLV